MKNRCIDYSTEILKWKCVKQMLEREEQIESKCPSYIRALYKAAIFKRSFQIQGQKNKPMQ